MHRTILAAALTVFALLAFPLLGARHETWIEVRSPNFIVLSNAGEKQARKTVIRFEQIRAVFRRSLPIASAHPSPVITIFAVKDEDSLRVLLPEFWTKGHMHPAGVFFSRLNQFYAAVNLDAQGSNPYEAIYHEYYHSVTLPYYPNLPLWLAEGLADFYGNTEIHDDYAGLGEPDVDLISELRNRGFIPLEVLLKVDHTSPYYNEANKTSIFYAESWALTHYLMVGDHESHKAMLGKYLDALDRGDAPDEAAAKAFGDIKKLQDALIHYIGNFSFFYLKAPPPQKIPDTDLQARALSDAELKAEEGSFFVIRGSTDGARPLLEEALRLDPKVALAHQSLAFADFFQGKREEALKEVSSAIAFDPKNSFTRYLRAYLSASGGGMNSRDSQLENDLRQAIALSPEFPPPYSLLAEYLAAGNEKLPEALAFAKKAVALEPGSPSALLSVAQVLARMQQYDEARLAAQRARQVAREPEERSHAEQFLAFLQKIREFQGNRVVVQGGATPAGNPTLRKRPPRDKKPTTEEEAEGMVTNVSCTGNEMQLRIATDSAVLTLHARDFTRVSFEQDVAFDGRDFNPCTQLADKSALITYVIVENERFYGEIQRVEVEK